MAPDGNELDTRDFQALPQQVQLAVLYERVGNQGKRIDSLVKVLWLFVGALMTGSVGVWCLALQLTK